MADKFDEMAGRVQLEMESWAMRQSIDGRRRVIAEALREAHGRGVEEGRASLQRKCEALERGMGQMRLIAGLPLPPNVARDVRLVREMRECLSTLVYWNERGHIDESWWEEARRLAQDEPSVTNHAACPYCGASISYVQRDGMAYARCSRRDCGARGPCHAELSRAVELFRSGVVEEEPKREPSGGEP